MMMNNLSAHKFVWRQLGVAFLGAWLRLRTFLFLWGINMSKSIQKRETDITGIELSPGKPADCLGNGEKNFECCCDECDHYLLCFPKITLKSKE